MLLFVLLVPYACGSGTVSTPGGSSGESGSSGSSGSIGAGGGGGSGTVGGGGSATSGGGGTAGPAGGAAGTSAGTGGGLGGARDSGAAGAGGTTGCAAGTTSCAGQCVTLSTDLANCGACGHACAAGQACVNGVCGCAAGQTSCSGTCTDTMSDPKNCGACGTACTATQVCSQGRCSAGCAARLTRCGNACVDTTGSAANCGACGMACPAGQSCSNSMCRCPTGQSVCDGVCTNTTTDVNHCGGCTTVCPGAEQTCAAGVCKCPVAGQTVCNGHCVDTTSDAANCGTCGHACAAPATKCLIGSCFDPNSCGTINSHPFTDCRFAWGGPDNGAGGNSSFTDFVSFWVGFEPNGGLASAATTATNNRCDGCTVAQRVASTNAMTVFYAYFIGYQACLLNGAGFCDCNNDNTATGKSDGHTLCTDGAQWIRTNRDLLIRMYGQYASKVFAASPNKPVIWWLEGDFEQYTVTATQTNALTMAELGALARDITCAIKSNEPNAVVAMNHAPWISNDQSNAFWSAMPMDVIDLVWVQGAGDTGTFPNSGSTNATTANYAWLSQKAGRPIMAETSFAAAGQNDRWTTTTAANINARIGEGVIGTLIVNPPSSFSATITSMSSQLNPVCQ